jgi:hypothetical protein
MHGASLLRELKKKKGMILLSTSCTQTRGADGELLSASRRERHAWSFCAARGPPRTAATKTRRLFCGTPQSIALTTTEVHTYPAAANRAAAIHHAFDRSIRGTFS